MNKNNKSWIPHAVEDFTIQDLIKFVTWEIKRLDAVSVSATSNERILWAAGKVAEETGEVWSDVLTHLGLSKKEKMKAFKIENLAEEIADVIIVTAILSKRLNIDLEDAIKKKMLNVKKRKYTDFYKSSIKENE